MSTIQRVIPMLVYNDIQAGHDFLLRAFGFESGGVHRDGEGRAVHGEVRAGDTTIWLHRAAAEHQLAAPSLTSTAAGGLVVFVSDVDAHCARAKAAGATVDQEPVDQPYGMREYGARDAEGHRWWFSMPIAASH